MLVFRGIHLLCAVWGTLGCTLNVIHFLALFRSSSTLNIMLLTRPQDALYIFIYSKVYLHIYIDIYIYISCCMTMYSHLYLRIWLKLTFCICCPRTCFRPKLNEQQFSCNFMRVFLDELAIRLLAAIRPFLPDSITIIMVVFFSKIAAIEVG